MRRIQEGIIISDNVLNHKWRPSIKVRGKARGIETVMYVNGQSWVGQGNVNKKKPKNTYRIFYVGDSNVSSVVPWGKQMAILVEKSLNQYYEPMGMNVIEKTIRLLQKNNIRVVLTGVPHYPQYNGTWSAKPHLVLAKTADKVGCHYLNSYEKLKDAIAGTPLTEFYWATDPTHFNVKGNLNWADTQVKFLLSNKDSLLPRCDDCFP